MHKRIDTKESNTQHKMLLLVKNNMEVEFTNKKSDWSMFTPWQDILQCNTEYHNFDNVIVLWGNYET